MLKSGCEPQIYDFMVKRSRFLSVSKVYLCAINSILLSLNFRNNFVLKMLLKNKADYWCKSGRQTYEAMAVSASLVSSFAVPWLSPRCRKCFWLKQKSAELAQCHLAGSNWIFRNKFHQKFLASPKSPAVILKFCKFLENTWVLISLYFAQSRLNHCMSSSLLKTLFDDL